MVRLADCAGRWVGANAFRMMPSDPFVERPATAALTLAAGGHLLSLAYTWEHPDDGPQDGLLVAGPGAEAGDLVCLWGDSWHQQPAPMTMAGSSSDDSIELGGDYGGGWRWQIGVRADAGSSLTLRMDNVIPADQATPEIAAGPYVVMRMTLRPA